MPDERQQLYLEDLRVEAPVTIAVFGAFTFLTPMTFCLLPPALK
jgi:hypothetical protein